MKYNLIALAIWTTLFSFLFFVYALADYLKLN